MFTGDLKNQQRSSERTDSEDMPCVKKTLLYIPFLPIALLPTCFAFSGSYCGPFFLFANHASLWSVSVCIFLSTSFRLYHIITFSAIYRHVLACLCLCSSAGLLPYKAESRSKHFQVFAVLYGNS
jgi:hypothetical protein